MKLLQKAEAVCMINETAEQTGLALNSGRDNTGRQKIRIRRFNNICKLTETIPSYMLHLSINEPFWEKIEALLD